jgi:hypothetical protein
MCSTIVPTTTCEPKLGEALRSERLAAASGSGQTLLSTTDGREDSLQWTYWRRGVRLKVENLLFHQRVRKTPAVLSTNTATELIQFWVGLDHSSMVQWNLSFPARAIAKKRVRGSWLGMSRGLKEKESDDGVVGSGESVAGQASGKLDCFVNCFHFGSECKREG